MTNSVTLDRHNTITQFCKPHLKQIKSSLIHCDYEDALARAGMFLSSAATLKFNRYIQSSCIALALQVIITLRDHTDESIIFLDELIDNLVINQ